MSFHAFGDASQCGVNEFWDAQVAACMCKPGTAYNPNMEQCMPTNSEGAPPEAYLDCLNRSGKRWIYGQCVDDCPPGYGFNADGQCVSMAEYDASHGGGGGGGVQSVATAAKAGLGNKTLLLGIAAVAGIATIAMLAKPKRATPNAREKLPKASGMGRPSWGTLAGARVNLRRVPLDRGGYDNGGAYWGSGEPLWHASGPDGEQWFRAQDRESAKKMVTGARFFK